MGGGGGERTGDGEEECVGSILVGSSDGMLRFNSFSHEHGFVRFHIAETPAYADFGRDSIMYS